MNNSSFDPCTICEPQSEAQLIDDETALFILKILLYGVTPAISVAGVCGNILSMMILTKNGLDKCSNILLVSLAFADTCFLIAVNNVPQILYDISGQGRFLYSYQVSYCLFILAQFFLIVDYGMCFVGLTIPAFITVERFIAVFFPLYMATIVTPARSWTVVIFFAVYGIAYMTYTCFWYRLDYSFDPSLNRSVGRMATTDLFYRHAGYRTVMDELHVSVRIQPLLTLVGCILIIVKVKMASIRRTKMSASSKRSSSVSKTTQTLMAVCLVYIIVCGIVSLPSFLPDNIAQYSRSTDEQSNLSAIVYQLMNIAVCTNGSWNFLIYICLNKNFRDSFKEIVRRCCCRTVK